MHVTSTSPSINTTTGLDPGKPFLGFSNPLWGQPNMEGILLQGMFPFESINPMIPMQQSLQPKYMGGLSTKSYYIGGSCVQSQYMG
jgi:hypothetical protein